MTNEVTAYTDAANRGNPGEGACAFIITKQIDGIETILYSNSYYLGYGLTNNQGEYESMKACLIASLAGGITDITVTSDSELMIRQLNGIYQVKSDNIKPLFAQVKDLSSHFTSITFIHTKRDHPWISQCDKMANEVLDRIARSHPQ